MTLADFNGDGNLDVLCIEGGGLIVLLGNGDGTFRTESLVPEASWMNYRMRVQSAVVGDFNGDGIPDIIYKTSNQIVELPGNGNGTFGRPRVVINLPGAYASSGGEFFGNLAIADINGDGKPDLIYEDRLAPGAIPSKGMPYGTVALLGNGDGTFSPPSSANLNNPAYGPVISAIDLGSGGGEAVLAAQLNGTFREIVNTFSPRPRSPSLNVPADLTFASGGAGSFLVSAGGYPTPSIAASGDLPPGLTFVDDGNGMGRLSGTPAPGDSGVYHFSLTASNGIDPAAEGSYLIDIVQAPVISSAGSATFPAGFASSFTIRAGGFPAPVLSEAGALPTGVSFTDLGDGTAALSVGPDAATGQYALVFSADSSAGTASQTFTLTISEAPSISTSSTAVFTSGTAGWLLISTAGFPNPTLNLSGALPAGVTFTDHQDGTATISGTPAAGAAGVFHLTLTASNGVGPGASQNVTLSVAAAPAITSSVGAAFAPGTAGSFIITTTGAPAAALTETGPLPAGMSFHDNGDGTATISGAPIYGAQGLYPLTLRAANMTGAATQTFNLNVGASGAAAPIIALLGYTLNGLGTTTNDIASINLAGGNLIVTIDSLTKSFPAGAVHSIYMTMNAGDDSLTIGAGVGAVFASGGEGNDTIVAYNSANDTLDGDAGNDSIAGGAGMDFLRGGAGNDTLVAGSGLNTLNGNTGDDSLVGGAGHALLNGGAGSNIILVGQNDTLVGGGGMDSILRGL
jgi:Ca2+-binding RTX toxin-like protein